MCSLSYCLQALFCLFLLHQLKTRREQRRIRQYFFLLCFIAGILRCLWFALPDSVFAQGYLPENRRPSHFDGSAFLLNLLQYVLYSGPNLLYFSMYCLLICYWSSSINSMFPSTGSSSVSGGGGSSKHKGDGISTPTRMTSIVVMPSSSRDGLSSGHNSNDSAAGLRLIPYRPALRFFQITTIGILVLQLLLIGGMFIFDFFDVLLATCVFLSLMALVSLAAYTTYAVLTVRKLRPMYTRWFQKQKLQQEEADEQQMHHADHYRSMAEDGGRALITAESHGRRSPSLRSPAESRHASSSGLHSSSAGDKHDEDGDEFRIDRRTVGGSRPTGGARSPSAFLHNNNALVAGASMLSRSSPHASRALISSQASHSSVTASSTSGEMSVSSASSAATSRGPHPSRNSQTTSSRSGSSGHSNNSGRPAPSASDELSYEPAYIEGDEDEEEEEEEEDDETESGSSTSGGRSRGQSHGEENELHEHPHQASAAAGDEPALSDDNVMVVRSRGSPASSDDNVHVMHAASSATLEVTAAAAVASSSSSPVAITATNQNRAFVQAQAAASAA